MLLFANQPIRTAKDETAKPSQLTTPDIANW